LKRHAIFVDAGYIFAQGSVSLLGKNSKRTDLKLDETEIVSQIKGLALSQSTNAEILRVYWYDGARNGPTVEHLAIANMQDVKLRLGSINNSGEQKEVDSLLVTDLIDLARNQSICDATLVASDSDLRIAVQIAQSFGVRVHLVGLEPSRVSQSPLLRQEADTVHEISKIDVAKFLTIVPTPPTSLGSGAVASTVVPIGPLAVPAATGVVTALQDILGDAIQRALANASHDDLLRLKTALSTSSAIPPEYDGRLLGICRTLLGRDLVGDERRDMRNGFKAHLSSLA
jgi:uncharacterized LabA/DUF88 family protein